MISPHAHIDGMDAYALSHMSVPQGKRLISLSQNESLRPPSPQVQAAMANAVGQSSLYPDPDWQDLRTKLAETHGVHCEGTLCGNGSLDLIGCLARIYAGNN